MNAKKIFKFYMGFLRKALRGSADPVMLLRYWLNLVPGKSWDHGSPRLTAIANAAGNCLAKRLEFNLSRYA
jgi:hypothetical protein